MDLTTSVCFLRKHDLPKQFQNKKVLPREGKRHTARRVASARYAEGGGGGTSSSPGGDGVPRVPPPSHHPHLAGGGGYSPTQTWDRVPPPDIGRGTPLRAVTIPRRHSCVFRMLSDSNNFCFLQISKYSITSSVYFSDIFNAIRISFNCSCISCPKFFNATCVVQIKSRSQSKTFQKKLKYIRVCTFLNLLYDVKLVYFYGHKNVSNCLE